MQLQDAYVTFDHESMRVAGVPAGVTGVVDFPQLATELAKIPGLQGTAQITSQRGDEYVVSGDGLLLLHMENAGYGPRITTQLTPLELREIACSMPRRDLSEQLFRIAGKPANYTEMWPWPTPDAAKRANEAVSSAMERNKSRLVPPGEMALLIGKGESALEAVLDEGLLPRDREEYVKLAAPHELHKALGNEAASIAFQARKLGIPGGIDVGQLDPAAALREMGPLRKKIDHAYRQAKTRDKILEGVIITGLIGQGLCYLNGAVMIGLRLFDILSPARTIGGIGIGVAAWAACEAACALANRALRKK